MTPIKIDPRDGNKITNCAECPFVHFSDRAWHCLAQDPWNNIISEEANFDGKIPDWCELEEYVDSHYDCECSQAYQHLDYSFGGLCDYCKAKADEQEIPF